MPNEPRGYQTLVPRKAGDPRYWTFKFVGGAGVAALLLAQPGHQQAFPLMKRSIACHLGGALLRGLVVCMIDSNAPHSPYWPGFPASAKCMKSVPPFAFHPLR